MKGLTVPKNVKEIIFERVLRELESKKYFQRQQLSKYLRLTVAFMCNTAQQEKFNFCFSRGFC